MGSEARGISRCGRHGRYVIRLVDRKHGSYVTACAASIAATFQEFDPPRVEHTDPGEGEGEAHEDDVDDLDARARQQLRHAECVQGQ